MEKVKNSLESDLNGNNSRSNGFSRLSKDQVTTADGRVFYPCRYCNKVFPIKKTRTIHMRKCPAKDYIFSVGEGPSIKTNESKEIETQQHIPHVQKTPVKIDIKQNIILEKQLDVTEILSKTKSPIKLTIRRSPSAGSDTLNHFTVSNSLILKEKNESTEEFSSIAQRLESNSVSLIKQPKETKVKELTKNDDNEMSCRECLKEFKSPLELLRHSRKCHSYPKVLMALSEVKKFYTVKDRSECPICHKPLKVNFRSAFVKHLHTHTNEMKYSCTVCSKKFRRSDHMKAHEKRHIIEKK